MHSLIKFTEHRQFKYSQNLNAFRSARLDYYLSKKFIETDFVFKFLKRVYLEQPNNQLESIAINLQKIAQLNPDVIIVTTCSDRYDDLIVLYESILKQKFHRKIAWVIVENGSTDKTSSLLNLWTKQHSWIVCLCSNFKFGYAAIARNIGLGFVQAALKYLSGNTFYWVIDSDDYIYNEYSIHELYKEAKKSSAVMTHGYAISIYENDLGLVESVNTIPRNIGSSFPLVKTLKDEFELGPQCLSGLNNCEYISRFYYPDEFTMEDDALNQRIMSLSLKNKFKITSIDFPCLVKRFHIKSMSGSNNIIGNQNIVCQLGPITIKGIRAQVALGLLHLRDYYTKEKI